MLFSEFPQLQRFCYNGQTYQKICPIFSSCCNIQYNAKGQTGYILLDEQTEIEPVVEEIPQKPKRKPVFLTSNLFTEGVIMLFRHVPMNSKFINGNEVCLKIGGDSAQKENGEVFIVNKNTQVELVGDIEDEVVSEEDVINEEEVITEPEFDNHDIN